MAETATSSMAWSKMEQFDFSLTNEIREVTVTLVSFLGPTFGRPYHHTRTNHYQYLHSSSEASHQQHIDSTVHGHVSPSASTTASTRITPNIVQSQTKTQFQFRLNF